MDGSVRGCEIGEQYVNRAIRQQCERDDAPSGTGYRAHIPRSEDGCTGAARPAHAESVARQDQNQHVRSVRWSWTPPVGLTIRSSADDPAHPARVLLVLRTTGW